MKLTVKEATKNFFDRTKVDRRLDRMRLRVHSKVGAFVRTEAKSSMRPHRRKRMGELTPHELADYRRLVADWKRRGRPGKRPLRPLVRSKPGEPPRSTGGLLKKHIYFVFDQLTDSTVIGPAQLKGTSDDVPHKLEYGGRVDSRRMGRSYYLEPRPFMRPALARVLQVLPGWMLNLASV